MCLVANKSPTRAAFLTGTAPGRQCISSAEGCGQQPAWSCDDSLPLPQTFTLAQAAKGAGYATIHVGKWSVTSSLFFRILSYLSFSLFNEPTTDEHSFV